MKLLRVSLILLLCGFMFGCSKEEAVETEPPIPTVSAISNRNAVFNCWGDEGLELVLTDQQVFKELTSTSAYVCKDNYNPDGVQLDYIQGVSLNDFGKCYWYSLRDSNKSEYDSGFSTSSKYYKFIRTEKNSFIMLQGSIDNKDFVDEIYAKLNKEES